MYAPKSKKRPQPSDPAAREAYEAFKVKVSERAMLFIKEVIPRKVLCLNQLVSTQSGSDESVSVAMDSLEVWNPPSNFEAWAACSSQRATTYDATNDGRTASRARPASTHIKQTGPRLPSSSVPFPAALTASLKSLAPMHEGLTVASSTPPPSGMAVKSKELSPALSSRHLASSRSTEARSGEMPVDSSDESLSEDEKDGSAVDSARSLIMFQNFQVHPQLRAMAQQTRKLCLDLVEMVQCLSLWLKLNVPKIEDGNNLGVEVQETLVSFLTTLGDTALKTSDPTRYHATRAELLVKLLKYPNVEDLRKAVAELDASQFKQQKIALVELRDYYCMLYDLLQKNWKKLTKPRSTDASMALMA